MKKMMLICTAIAIFLPNLAFAGDVSLMLWEKDPSDWSIIEGGASAELTYKAEGPTFDFTLNGTVPVPGQAYTLIYYPDPWPGNNLIVLGSDDDTDDGSVLIDGNVEEITGLPIDGVDANSPTGAKIWLVLSADVNTTLKKMITWRPMDYLFEDHLILFPLETTSDARSKGYWKHQVKANQSGKGSPDYTEIQLLALSQEIRDRFYLNSTNFIDIEGVTNVGGAALSMNDLAYMLNINQGGITMLERAKQQFLALLLNVASDKVSLYFQAAVNGATASQAIVYIDQILETDPELAKDIAETINEGLTIVDDWIPMSTPFILFSESLEAAFSLSRETFHFPAPAPNPFNPATSLSFQLPEAAQVTLAVFDVSGRKVAQLVDGWLDAGAHQAVFDGSGLASGIYLARIEAANYSAMQKVVLLK